MAVSPETERQWIEGWKAEWRPFSLNELYELREELIRVLDEARTKDEEEPGMIPPYSYGPSLRVKAIDELINEKLAIARIWDWLKVNGKWLVGGGIGIALIIVLARRK